MKKSYKNEYLVETISVMRKKLEEKRILPLKSQGELWSEILSDKINNILPKIMEKSGIQFWTVICREYNEDPVFKTLATWDAPHARRLSILSFYLDEATGEFKKYIIGISSKEMDKIYDNASKKGEHAIDTLVRLIKDLNPKNIGINTSIEFGLCDGLSSTLYKLLMDKLNENHLNKIVSAEDLCVRWLECMSVKEQEIHKFLVEVTHDIINASYSDKLIEKEVTTTTDVEWFMRECIAGLDMDFWFGPDVDVQRCGFEDDRLFDKIIEKGDLIHCDIGLTCKFMPLNTDVQRLCYVLKDSEEDAPQDLKNLLKLGNRLQDIVTENIQEGLSGNDVFLKSLNQARKEGLDAMIYTHPLGSYGHGAGPIIGLYDKQEFIPVRGERKFNKNTCYALELNVKADILTWNGTKVAAYLEEDICYTDKAKYISGRQTELMCF